MVLTHRYRSSSDSIRRIVLVGSPSSPLQVLIFFPLGEICTSPKTFVANQ